MKLRKTIGCLIAMLMAAAASAAPAQEPDITAGPVVGHSTDKSARIWLELREAKKVTVSAYLNNGRFPASQVSVDVEGLLPFVADVPLNNLLPNATYNIELKLDDQPVNPPPPPLVVRTMPPQGQEAAFTIGFGSCIDAGAGTGAIFKQVMNVGPRAFFFLGNSGYLPGNLNAYPQSRRAAVRFICDMHDRVRREADLQALFRTTPIYAVWGEHDFGTDHAGKDFVFAKESLTAFQHFYPNPDWGTPALPGCFFTSSIGDADFFCLDDRMYRDPLDASGNAKSMLGDQQVQWLEQALLASKATFKVIAAADPLLADEPGSWSHFQPEQGSFLQWLGAHHVSGVVFMSGGKVGELSVQKRPGTYPLVEMTSGPLDASAPVGAEPANAARSGTAVDAANFGTLEFGGEGVNRFVTLRLRDASGKIRIEQTLLAGQLR
ncbi:MAG TPA: alkaline phosphatase D family protein [Phycisphaerae bacterium]|nr:alkaline phosphatase D family protein [Phycisphaerae bacterium]